MHYLRTFPTTYIRTNTAQYFFSRICPLWNSLILKYKPIRLLGVIPYVTITDRAPARKLKPHWFVPWRHPVNTKKKSKSKRTQRILNAIMETVLDIDDSIDVNDFMLSEDTNLIQDFDHTIVDGMGDEESWKKTIRPGGRNERYRNLHQKEIQEYSATDDDYSASAGHSYYQPLNNTSTGSKPPSPTRQHTSTFCSSSNAPIISPENTRGPLSGTHITVSRPRHEIDSSNTLDFEYSSCDDESITSDEPGGLDGLYHQSLQKMATNMTRTDESRAEIIRERRRLSDIYRSREHKNDLLCWRRTTRRVEMEMTRKKVLFFILDNLSSPAI